MRRARYVLCFALLAMPLAAGATSPVSLDELLQSSIKHFPKIQQAKASRDASEAAVTQALGAFDASFQNSSYLRASGFYDGKFTDSKLVKPLQDYNAKVSAGYRISDGDFPIYENYHFTNRDGEFNFELFLSLLRDRDIDDDRLALWNNRLRFSKAEQQLLLSKIATQRAAMVAYYEWIAASHMLSIQQDLVELAKARQKALKQRHAHGDIAAITVTENEQYLFRREGQLNDAQRLYANAAANLSLYWRDASGNPIVPQGIGSADFPGAIDHAAINKSVTPEDLYRLRPEIKALEADIAAEENELNAGKNSLLPRADLTFRSSRDIGSGSFTREETEHVVGLNFSVPLQRNLGEGRAAKARANLRALEQERRLLRDQIAQQLLYLANNLRAAENNIEWSRKEFKVASSMQSSEEKLFASGGSDYFLLNQREEQYAAARIKNVSATLEYYRTLADAYAATVQLDKLSIDG